MKDLSFVKVLLAHSSDFGGVHDVVNIDFLELRGHLANLLVVVVYSYGLRLGRLRLHTSIVAQPLRIPNVAPGDLQIQSFDGLGAFAVLILIGFDRRPVVRTVASHLRLIMFYLDVGFNLLSTLISLLPC